MEPSMPSPSRPLSAAPRPRHLVLPLIGLALSGLLVACGGGSDSPPSTGPDTSTPPPPPPPSPPPPPPGFSLSLDGDKAIVWQGNEANVTVNVQRETGFADAVQVALQDLPTGVSAGAVTVAAGSTSGTVRLQAVPTAPHSLPTAVKVNGTSGTLAATKPLTATVRGKAGDVDTSFGGGVQTTPVGLTDDYARGAAVQGDGKVIVAGYGVPGGDTGTDFLIVRYLRDGGLDTTFGTAGKVITAFNNGNRSDEAQAVAVQADGKILVAGSSDQGATGYDFALSRYNTDGSLDATFGAGGRVVTSFGNGADKLHAMLIQPDGKILLAGESGQGANGTDFAIARYNTDGSLDAGFGTGGKVLTPIGANGTRESIYALALQTLNGTARIVAVGGEGDFIAARYLANGQLDGDFGVDGIVQHVFGSVTGAARGVVVTADNKLVVAGHREHDFAAVRLTANGALDAGFGTAGKAVVAVNAANWDEATALVQQEDGKLLLGGWAYTGGSSSGNTALVRLMADGTPDDGFGTHGIVITAAATGTKNDQGQALVLQPDSRVPTVRVLQAGEANGSNHDFVLIRYWL